MLWCNLLVTSDEVWNVIRVPTIIAFINKILKHFKNLDVERFILKWMHVLNRRYEYFFICELLWVSFNHLLINHCYCQFFFHRHFSLVKSARNKPNSKANESTFIEASHCIKSVRIRSFSGQHFPAFGLNTDIYRVNFHIHSRKMQENANQKNAKYGHFWRNE